MSLKFTPAMFAISPDGPFFSHKKEIASAAQDIFDKWLSEQKVIYGWPGDCDKLVWHGNKDAYDDEPTHSARLVDIREIKAEKCEHDVMTCHVPGPQTETFGTNFVPLYVCKKCGVKLKPNWTEI